MKSQLPLARKDDLVIQNLPEETLVYDCKTHKAFCLNKTSASVWNYCDGKTDVARIADLMGKEFNSPVSEDLVWLSISQLEQENLLAGKTEFSGTTSGLNRREVIRRTAIAAAIALPIVSSITAPPAISAQSGQPVACDTQAAAATAVGATCPAGCGAVRAACDFGNGNCDAGGVCRDTTP